MNPEDLRTLVADIRSSQSESNTIEVKTAQKGTPKKLYRAFSAFANQTGGGIILFGLDESKGFAITGAQDVHRLQEEITQVASQDNETGLAPPVYH